jgi:hypothetical protein
MNRYLLLKAFGSTSDSGLAKVDSAGRVGLDRGGWGGGHHMSMPAEAFARSSIWRPNQGCVHRPRGAGGASRSRPQP